MAPVRVRSFAPSLRGAVVERALSGVATKTVAGPDGFPVGLYTELPSTIPSVCGLFRRFLGTGRNTPELSITFLAPLDNPGYDAEFVALNDQFS